MTVFGSIVRRLHEYVYESRLESLIHEILPHISKNFSILDIGCGFGELGKKVLAAPGLPKGVSVRGIERTNRNISHIEIDVYHTDDLPYTDNTFDCVFLMDVLHHEKHRENLISEAIRISRNIIIIKDHKIDGFLAKARVAFMDWAANAPYDIPCLYEYHTLSEWREIVHRMGLEKIFERTSMPLYPFPFNFVFGNKLHYLVVLSKKTNSVSSS